MDAKQRHALQKFDMEDLADEVGEIEEKNEKAKRERLRAFLRTQGISEAICAQIAKGEVPDTPRDALRKGSEADALRKAALQKAADEYVANLPQVRECYKIIGDIKAELERVDKFMREPDPRNPRPYFAGATQHLNGAGVTLDELLKGTKNA
jgi:hypothetical protein